MTLEPVERAVVINVDAEQLRHGPILAQPQQAASVSQQWLAGLYEQYHVPPYWQDER